jgi:hypothetical protein
LLHSLIWKHFVPPPFNFTQCQLYLVLAPIKILQTQCADNQNFSGHHSLTNSTAFINKSDYRKLSDYKSDNKFLEY